MTASDHDTMRDLGLWSTCADCPVWSRVVDFGSKRIVSAYQRRVAPTPP